MLWLIVGVLFALLAVLGYLLFRLHKRDERSEILLQQMETDRSAMVEDRLLLRELLQQVKTWVKTNECHTDAAVEEVKKVTDEQTKIIREEVHQATNRVVERVPEKIAEVVTASSTKTPSSDDGSGCLPVVKPNPQ